MSKSQILHNLRRYPKSPGLRLTLDRYFKRPVAWFGRSIPSYLPFYLLLIVVAYAGWKGWPRATVISSFQMPPDNKERPMPFNGEAVAEMLQDYLTAVQNEAQGVRIVSPPCDQMAVRHEDFGGLAAGPGPAFRVGGHVVVEVKGMSVDALISVAREVIGHETTVTGDVLLDGTDRFQLIARTETAGPWVVRSQPLSLSGLRAASCEMADAVLESRRRNRHVKSRAKA